MTLALGIVALVASTALGFVYEWTKEPIAKAKLEKQKRAINSVLDEHNNDPLAEKYRVFSEALNDSLETYPAYQSEDFKGNAVKTYSPKGYGGQVWLMVGFNPDKTVRSISVLEHKETPGLGSKMTEPKFLEQFIGKNPQEFKLKVKKDGGDIDALTGATITSRAFGDAVSNAYKTLK